MLEMEVTVRNVSTLVVPALSTLTAGGGCVTTATGEAVLGVRQASAYIAGVGAAPCLMTALLVTHPTPAPLLERWICAVPAARRTSVALCQKPLMWVAPPPPCSTHQPPYDHNPQGWTQAMLCIVVN